MRTTRIWKAAAVTIALAASMTVAAPAQAAGTIDKAVLQHLLDAEVAAGMPGVFAVVRDGATTVPLAAGVADVKTHRRMKPTFQHRVGSITKTFVAVTVLQLVAEGKIGLDEPIATYLPVPTTHADGSPDPRGQHITVRMLLQHTSGLGNYTDVVLSSLETIRWAQKTTVAPEVLANIGWSMTPLFTPGTSWSYSNTNFIALGLIIQKVTGHTVAAEVSKRILKPLHLASTYFPGTAKKFRGAHSRAYLWAGSRLDFTDFNMSAAWAAGEMISTAADLNTFFRALMAGTLLAPAQQTAMFTMAPIAPGFGYGLGLISVTLPCPSGPTTFYGHTGGVIGQQTIAMSTRDGSRQFASGDNQTGFATPAQEAAVNAAGNAVAFVALCGAPPAAGSTMKVMPHLA